LSAVATAPGSVKRADPSHALISITPVIPALL
jgi:hypothetical protein